MNIKPLHDRVLVRRKEEETKTASGIIIPDSATEKPMQAEVLSVGTGARDDAGRIVPMDVRVGDIVMFTKWAGTEVKVGGEELLIMKESDIIAIVENSVAAKKAA